MCFVSSICTNILSNSVPEKEIKNKLLFYYELWVILSFQPMRDTFPASTASSPVRPYRLDSHQKLTTASDAKEYNVTFYSLESSPSISSNSGLKLKWHSAVEQDAHLFRMGRTPSHTTRMSSLVAQSRTRCLNRIFALVSVISRSSASALPIFLSSRLFSAQT